MGGSLIHSDAQGKTIESPDMQRSVLMRVPGVGIPLRD